MAPVNLLWWGPESSSGSHGDERVDVPFPNVIQNEDGVLYLSDEELLDLHKLISERIHNGG